VHRYGHGLLQRHVRWRRDRQEGEAVEAKLGSVIELGSLAVAIRAISDVDRPLSLDLRRHVGASGAIPFNRPHRPARAPAPKPIVAPKEPGKPTKPHFSAATTFGPLVVAAGMIAFTGQIQYALFALLTPIMALGSYAESRRRASKGGSQSRHEYETQLAEFEHRLRGATEAERARLRDVCPDPGEALRRAALPSVRLWSAARATKISSEGTLTSVSLPGRSRPLTCSRSVSRGRRSTHSSRVSSDTTS
jgi:S-DNA-T family DNA segregation ATPase FtsK/SpoIIIE